MNRSDRIRLVQAVRESLFTETPEQADLVLRTFGLEGLDLESEWQDYDPKVDVRKQVTDADAETLLDIAAHLSLSGFETEGRRTSGDFDYLWRPAHIRVFICHLAKHQAFASAVVEVLHNLQIDGFVAHTSIEPDLEWQIEIQRALDSCDVFVGLVHPEFSKSYWTQQEVGWALGRGVPLYMVSLGEVPVGFPARHQASRATDVQPFSAASRIIVSLSRSHQFGEEVAGRVMESLENARSFSDARDAALQLEQMGQLSPRILDGICRAYIDNDQIHPNHVAVPLIRRILVSHGRQLPEM
jgi:hypothetical protein